MIDADVFASVLHRVVNLSPYCSDGPLPQSLGLTMRCLVTKLRCAKSINNQISIHSYSLKT